MEVKQKIMAKSKKKTSIIPSEVEEYFLSEVFKLKVYGLSVRRSGKFFYVYVENSPLCRFTYQGDMKIWGFAIYKYSTSSYSDNEFLFPSRGKIRDCLTSALKAYNYL